MTGPRFNQLLTTTSLLSGFALCALGGSGWSIVSEPWPLRLGLLGGGLTLLAATIAAWAYAQHRQRRAVERQFEALCRRDEYDAYGETTAGNLPPLRSGNPWRRTVEKVRTTLTELAARVQELEHARASLDIRCRRATDQSEQIRKILSGLGDPILALNDYQEVVLANQSAAALFDFDADEQETRILADLVECRQLVDLMTAMSRRSSPGNRSDELELTDREGTSHWYRVTACRLVAEAGDGEASKSGSTVAVLRDIGDQKTMQKRNAEFVSAVSHEMKTPLAGIKAYVELLVDGDAEDEATQEEFLGVINGQADRLQRLVDNMLNLARIEAGVVNVSKQTRPLNELLEEAASVVQPAAEAKQIELTADLSPMYLGVLADRDMLLQSAINLLSNAVKYTPSGGRVTLRSRMEDDRVRFEVEDTGVGLSEEDCSRVFDKFYRVKKDKDMAAGTGLGLPLAKHIVEDVHGGSLEVRSVLGQGSTFVVTLPNAGQLS